MEPCPGPRIRNRAVWAADDGPWLITFSTEHKTEAGDGGNFKNLRGMLPQPIPLLTKEQTEGACKNKEYQVRTVAFFLKNVLKRPLSNC